MTDRARPAVSTQEKPISGSQIAINYERGERLTGVESGGSAGQGAPAPHIYLEIPPVPPEKSNILPRQSVHPLSLSLTGCYFSRKWHMAKLTAQMMSSLSVPGGSYSRI